MSEIKCETIYYKLFEIFNKVIILPDDGTTPFLDFLIMNDRRYLKLWIKSSPNFVTNFETNGSFFPCRNGDLY
jgi:hypothetical protein